MAIKRSILLAEKPILSNKVSYSKKRVKFYGKKKVEKQFKLVYCLLKNGRCSSSRLEPMSYANKEDINAEKNIFQHKLTTALASVWKTLTRYSVWAKHLSFMWGFAY